MKKYCFTNQIPICPTIWVTIMLLLCQQGMAQNRPDFSGVDAFWNMYECYRQDKYPSEEQWQSLLSTPGYRYLVKNEGKDKLFRELFPIAFMPSRKGERDTLLAAGNNRYLNHYVEIHRQRDELKRFQKKLESQYLLKDALPLTAEYLPSGFMETVEIPPPDIFFAFFEPDGKANSELVVVDLLFATYIDLVPFLAHEAHHFYKGHLTRVALPESDNPDYYLLRSIRQLQTEGVADLIDKRDIIEHYETITDQDTWYSRNYKQHMQQADKVFESIDSLMIKAMTDEANRVEYGKKIWDMLPFGAHPHGGYMAVIIEQALGKDAIIYSLDNPFKFIRLFNRAARSITFHPFVFSDKAMDYIDDLERRYTTDKLK